MRSPHAFNSLTGYVFIAPVTGTRRGWPFEVPIPPGGKVSGVVLADQTKSIDRVAGHVRYIDTAPVGLVEVVVERVAVVLAFAGM